MKAIPREPKPCVLAFNFEGERLAALTTICEELELGLVNHCASTSPEAFVLSLGDLVDGGSVSSATKLAPEARLAMNAFAFPDEMFYLASLSGDKLDAFLQAIRQKDLWIPLKAVATPTNASWRPMALRSELMEEHAAMQAMMEERRQAAAENAE